MSEFKRIHLTLPQDIVELIDLEAKKRFMDRSNFIRMVLTHKVMEAQIEDVGGQDSASLGAVLETATGKQINMEVRPGVPKDTVLVVDEEKFSIKEEKKDTWTSVPTVGFCIHCKSRKEVVTLIYEDLSDTRHEYQICTPEGVEWAKRQVREAGGTIISIDGKEYE